MTSATAITSRVIRALNRAGVPQMLVGAFSRNAYAPPRSTPGADVVIALAGQSLRAVAEAPGADGSLESQTGFEANTGTLRDTLTHTDSHFTIELFHLSADAHDHERCLRRRQTSVDGEPTSIPTPEDVIITKTGRHNTARVRRSTPFEPAPRRSSELMTLHHGAVGPGVGDRQATKHPYTH